MAETTPTPESESHMDDQTQTRLPSQTELDTVSQVDIFDANGESRKFHSLLNPDGAASRRTIIVFIRHFFCGSCEEYVRTLSSDLPPADLASGPLPTTLTIIGCGDRTLISDYIKRTGCKFDVYTDPSRSLYDNLGMTCSLALGNKPDYIKKSFWTTSAASTFNVLSQISTDSGKKSQNGGEFVWIDGVVKWARRMKTTRDHVEVKELKRVLNDQGKHYT